MPDLKSFLAGPSKTVEAIYAHYKKVGDSEPSRGYLGASIIGHPCERYLWFNFRDCCKPKFSGRMYRLFETGDLAEERFVKNLRDIGCTVHEADENGEQFAVSALGGHFSGHLDGCVLNLPEAPKTWHVLEGKTHNNKNFKKLVKESVSVAFWKHYAQVMIYMHLTKMKRALYLATNKDTDELYSERVYYNPVRAEALMEKAERVITSAQPPVGISDRADFWQCKFCDAKDVCFGLCLDPAKSFSPVLNLPRLSCRQCCHATAQMDGIGRWSCEKRKKTLSTQLETCKDHLVLPGMLPRFTPIEYKKDPQGNDFIRFQSQDGSEWDHGQGKGKFSSKELMAVQESALTNAMVARAKELFDGQATGQCEDILDRYPKELRSVVWEGRIDKIVEAWEELRVPWDGPNDAALTSLEPIARTVLPTHCVAEYADNVIVVAYVLENRAEIIQQIPF